MITCCRDFLYSDNNLRMPELEISPAYMISGETIAGASVVIQGTLTGTAANPDGIFVLRRYTGRQA
jgi:hypothetical protein